MSNTIDPNKDPRQEQGQKSTEPQTTAMPTAADTTNAASQDTTATTMPIVTAPQDTAARTQPTTAQGTSDQRAFPSPYAAPAPVEGAPNATPLSGASTAQRDPGLADLAGSGQQAA